MIRTTFVAALLAGIALMGCTSSGSPTSPGTSFDSNHPSALLGNWLCQFSTGSSTTSWSLTLVADGSFSSLSIITSSGNMDQFPAQGTWSVSGDTLMMQQTGRTAGYSLFTVSASQLHLSSIGAFDTSTYVRQ
jgi:hypothetical protein